MMNNPLVSVIIPTKNRFNILKGAIDNVREQTYSNIEIIIVEDGSDCGVEQHINNLADNRIIYQSIPVSKGLATARDTGSRIAKGKYVAFLDDDDRWLSDKIKLQVEVINKYPDENCMVFCWTCKITNGNIIQGNNLVIRGSMTERFFKGFTLPSSCMIIPKNLLLSIGGHSDELKSCVDHDLWMKLANAGCTMDLVPMGLIYCPEHNYSKMINRLDERLEGIKQFFEKWKPIVVSKVGINSWYYFERLYHMQTAKTIIDQKKRGFINKKQSDNYMRKLFQLQHSKVTISDKFALALEFPNLTPVKIRKIRFLKKFFLYQKYNRTFTD